MRAPFLSLLVSGAKYRMILLGGNISSLLQITFDYLAFASVVYTMVFPDGVVIDLDGVPGVVFIGLLESFDLGGGVEQIRKIGK